MRKLNLRIYAETEAFKDQYSGEYSKSEEGRELCCCLRSVIKKIEDGWSHGGIYDRNGNKVGSWRRFDDEVIDRKTDAENRKEL